MNVLLLTDKLSFGGAEIYFCKLENHLEHPDINFYYAAGPGDLQNRIANKDHYVELKRDKHYGNLLKLRKVVKLNGISIIHANSLRMVMYGIALKMMTRKPIKLLYTKHNITWLELKSRRIFSTIMNRFVDRIITVSDFEKNSLLDSGVRKDILKTIYNGVDLEQFIFREKKEGQAFNVGALARLSEEKNLEFFIEIARKCNGMKNVNFVIGGDGPERNKLETLINRYGLSGNVKMLGSINHPEKFIGDMDVMLLTSNREVFPMVVLESMAVGTPIISIDRGGISEALLEGQTGYLVSEHSTEAFHEKILTLFSDSSKQRELSMKARSRVEKEFSLKKMVDETLQEYLERKDIV
ncbi:glycosyltransferase family 4 protein [Halobacillus sp. Nhm2S1]|uniref:glycosyltransferase family 4 protein n=1 Tax=Halobacillus sp. Nhm2S1 TaxID=2866716 RepID=UPI001C72D8E9|nr:glycosyltransferase family 4 protein [Halobacillus sp. Nhm2S1]MBX0357653.1 glycosyltransferase family 4 protein [Halobacillus sp. Nhm2S1]